VLEVWWNFLIPPWCKFTAKSDGARILEIG